MKNVLKVLGIIALVAVIGFSMVSCGDDDSGGGGKVPTELVGKWYSDSGKTNFVFQVYDNGGVDDAPDKPNETFGKITLKSGTGASGVFTYKHNLFPKEGADVNFTTASNTLVIGTWTAYADGNGFINNFLIQNQTYYK